MHLIDKTFKIGLIALGLGFLLVYAYHQHLSASYYNRPASSRYVTTVGGVGALHMVYLIDTQQGTVYYARATMDTIIKDQPLTWKVSYPQAESKR